MPPPHSMRSWVIAAPSLDANAMLVRIASDSASLWTIRGSPRIAPSAASSSSSRSSSERANGSISHGELQWPRAGGSGSSHGAGRARRQRRGELDGARERALEPALASRREWPRSRTRGPATATRMPTPTSSSVSTRSTAPPPTRSRSVLRSTQRASAYSQPAGGCATSSRSRSSGVSPWLRSSRSRRWRGAGRAGRDRRAGRAGRAGGRVDREQVDDEDQRRVRRDRPLSGRAVGERRRDDQLAPAADAHARRGPGPSPGSRSRCSAGTSVGALRLHEESKILPPL